MRSLIIRECSKRHLYFLYPKWLIEILMTHYRSAFCCLFFLNKTSRSIISLQLLQSSNHVCHRNVHKIKVFTDTIYDDISWFFRTPSDIWFSMPTKTQRLVPRYHCWAIQSYSRNENNDSTFMEYLRWKSSHFE